MADDPESSKMKRPGLKTSALRALRDGAVQSRGSCRFFLYGPGLGPTSPSSRREGAGTSSIVGNKREGGEARVLICSSS